MRLILGSGSPRRKELLAQIGVMPEAIRPPDIDETPGKTELPRPYCARMAAEKAAATEAEASDLVLAADTTVALGRRSSANRKMRQKRRNSCGCFPVAVIVSSPLWR